MVGLTITETHCNLCRCFYYTIKGTYTITADTDAGKVVEHGAVIQQNRGVTDISELP
jgi:hypothetical protein